MTGLVLKLGPRERIMINGVVMENGDRRARLNVITRDARVLRLRDAIHPDEVNTPVTRVLYIAQMVLAGEADPEDRPCDHDGGYIAHEQTDHRIAASTQRDPDPDLVAPT